MIPKKLISHAAMLVMAASGGSLAAEGLVLEVRRAPNGIELSWQPEAPLSGPAEFRVEESNDLINWRPRARIILEEGRTEPWRAEFRKESPHRFFRISSRFDVELVRTEGAGVLGYEDVFARKLGQIGLISPEQFAARYDSAEYLEQLTWDPTTAAFFDDYQKRPEHGGVKKFPLTDAELEVFKEHGFVATDRLRFKNFGDVYYQIFVQDLPVFITADSILHAWHRSYHAMLEQLEDAYLYTLLDEVLAGMAAELPGLAEEIAEGPLLESLRDADYYLAMARSFLAGTNQPSHFGQDKLVATTLEAAARGGMIPFNLFGRLERKAGHYFDFSQFKVRGHYAKSARLQRYFQAMMWCGRVDLRIAGNPEESSPRELGTALVLTELLERSGKFEEWAAMDQIIQVFVGTKDSMDPRQMRNILRLAGAGSVAELQSPGALAAIKAEIESGAHGVQAILGDVYQSPFSGDQIWLPRSFTIMGQRFTVDAWAMGKFVFDRILWDENGIPELSDKVTRRRGSALDVAFSVLNNNTPVPEIVRRIQDTDGHWLRDGLPYQHNLAAVRETVNAQAAKAWEASIYAAWLGALRELSEPTTGPEYPESMRTRAWARRRMNTQLGSWAELRHDTVLYSKPAYAGHITCFYPDGFVEPMPGFWNRMKRMAERSAELIAGLRMEGTVPWEARGELEGSGELDLAVVQSNQVSFLNRFAQIMGTLEEIARKQLAQQPLSEEESAFLGNTVEDVLQYEGQRTYSGWYPSLYYLSNEGLDHITDQAIRDAHARPGHDSESPVELVTDVLTAPFDELTEDPGAILHQSLGGVAFMLVAVDNGPDKMVFGGPIYMHYEFNMPLDQRLTDAEWKARSEDPPLPEWTEGWLFP